MCFFVEGVGFGYYVVDCVVGCVGDVVYWVGYVGEVVEVVVVVVG